MKLLAFLLSFLKPVKQIKSEVVQQEQAVVPPTTVQEEPTVKTTPLGVVQSQRQTIPADVTALNALASLTIKPPVSAETYRGIAHLCLHEPDFSRALQNTVTMGTTPINISFDRISDEDRAAEMTKMLFDAAKLWYSGGIPSLFNHLLSQCAVYGTLSAEIVLDPTLKGVKAIVLVDPSTIEFKYNGDLTGFIPVQKPRNGFGMTRENVIEIDLNPVTFKYHAVKIHPSGEYPYGIPPFLSGLCMLTLDKDILNHFAHIIEKIGLMGFLQVLVNAPARLPYEDDTQYLTRTQTYLETVITPQVMTGLSSGVMVGTKDQVDVAMQATNQNATGAREIHTVIDQRKLTGLGQDPAMLGRDYRTTETYGEVILKTFSSQLTTYQAVVCQFLQEVFTLHLALSGAGVQSITVEADRPTIADELKSEQAYEKRISNRILLYNQGIISQQQLAQELGYEMPAEDEPRSMEPDTPEDDTEDVTEDDVEDAENSLLQGLPMQVDPFEYSHHGCCNHIESLNQELDELDSFTRKYFNDLEKGFLKATRRVAKKIGQQLTKLSDAATERTVVNNILLVLYTEWNAQFTDKQETVIRRWVNKIHKYYRSNKEFLEGLSTLDPANPPKAVFSALDMRTIEYYRRSDTTYLGKFITDKDLNKKITEFIKDKYIGQNLPIGKGAEAYLNSFIDQLEELLNTERWKITRIVSTTTNRMRNTAGLMYMADAEIQEYKIVSVNDRLRCDWCAKLSGKTFSVEEGKQEINNLSQSDPTTVKSVSPFITSEADPAELTDLTGREIYAKYGFVAPPSHPHCRCTIVAVQ